MAKLGSWINNNNININNINKTKATTATTSITDMIFYLTLTLSPMGTPPYTKVANYTIFCQGNSFFYHLTFIITGIDNFW